jgi:hypothetical protein
LKKIKFRLNNVKLKISLKTITQNHFLTSTSVNVELLCVTQKYLLEDHYSDSRRKSMSARMVPHKFNKFTEYIFYKDLCVNLWDSLQMSEFDMEQETPTGIVVYAMKLVKGKLYIAPIVIPVDNGMIDLSCKVKIKRWYQTIDDPNNPEIGKTLHEVTPQDAAEFDRENRPTLKPIAKTKVETVQKPQGVPDPEVTPEVTQPEIIKDAKIPEGTETQEPQTVPDLEVSQPEVAQQLQDASDHEVPSEVPPPEVIEGTETIEKSQTDLVQNQNLDSSVNKPEFDKVETKSKIISFVLFLLIAAGVTSLAILKSINLCKIIIPCIGLATIAFGLSLVFCFAENIFNSCVNNEHQKKLNNDEYQIKAPFFAKLFVDNKTFQELDMLSHEPQNESQTIEYQKN